MSTSLDKFRAKLVIKIVYAKSAGEVRRFIHAAIRGMQRAKVGGQVIARFVDRILNQLELLQQRVAGEDIRANIAAARMSLHQALDLIGNSPGLA